VGTPLLPSGRLPVTLVPPVAITPVPFDVVSTPALPVWPWIVLLLLVAAVVYRMWRRRAARPRVQAEQPLPRAFTFSPRIDPGRQAIAVGGRSRSLEFAIRLDPGIQQLREYATSSQMGAVS
jgi:hypothetical protein